MSVINKKNAFSMVEVLVGMAILAIVIGIAANFFTDMNKNKEITKQELELINHMNLVSRTLNNADSCRIAMAGLELSTAAPSSVVELPYPDSTNPILKTGAKITSSIEVQSIEATLTPLNVARDFYLVRLDVNLDRSIGRGLKSRRVFVPVQMDTSAAPNVVVDCALDQSLDDEIVGTGFLCADPNQIMQGISAALEPICVDPVAVPPVPPTCETAGPTSRCPGFTWPLIGRRATSAWGVNCGRPLCDLYANPGSTCSSGAARMVACRNYVLPETPFTLYTGHIVYTFRQ